MAIIDSQIHAYAANTPQRPWKSKSMPGSPPSATGDEHVAAMDKLGVDGAIFVSSFAMYEYENRCTEKTSRRSRVCAISGRHADTTTRGRRQR